MAAGDISMPFSDCGCVKFTARASVREFVGEVYNFAAPLTNNDHHYFLRLHVDILNNGGGNGEPNGTQDVEYSIEPETYGTRTFTPDGGQISIIVGGNPLPLPTLGPGDYVWLSGGTGGPYALQSFTPGDSYTLTLLNRLPRAGNTPIELNYYYSDELTEERLSDILEEDLQGAANRAWTDPRGGWHDADENRFELGELKQWDNFGNLLIHEGHALRHIDRNNRYTTGDPRSTIPGWGSVNGYGILRRSIIRVGGQHSVREYSVINPFVGVGPVLDCENLEITCESVHTLDPPETNGRRLIWSENEVCAP